MKFQDLLKNIFLEQPEDMDEPMIDDDGDEINPDAGVHGFDDAEFAADDPEDHDIRAHPPRPQGQRPEKKLSATQQIKLKWEHENPGVPDFQFEDAIEFFNERKERLKIYHPYGYVDPTTNRHYINVPEIAVLVERFPDMISVLSNLSLMKDLKNYPWEVMAFWMHRIRTETALIDDENIVEGALTPAQELENAYQRWTNPRGQIVNEGGVTVYRVESVNESIALGSIQRLLYEKRGRKSGENVWCVARPLNNSRYGSNLYMSYRNNHHRSFYMVLDKNYPETHDNYMVAIQPVLNSDNPIVTRLRNDGDNSTSWREIIRDHPALDRKQNLFKYFPLTPKEKGEFTISKITFTPGSEFYFATLPPIYQRAYIESNRHINHVPSFLGLDPNLRKLYVDTTTKDNNDFQRRFLCSDSDDPFGILEILRLQTKPDDLYKYLDAFILKTKLQIPEGIIAIKKSIIGTNWKRWLSDVTTNYTLITKDLSKDPRHKPTYGLMDIDKGELVKNVSYKPTSFVRSYLYNYTDDIGIHKQKRYFWQRYDYVLGNGNPDPNEYFYFLFLQDATKVGSENYLQGKMYEGAEGDQFIQDKIASGEFKRM